MKANAICCYCITKCMTKEALQNPLHAYINKTRLTITTLENMPTLLFKEPLKFICLGNIFKRLEYNL